MQPIEIIVILASLSIVLGVLGSYIYKRVHHLPTGECSCCRNKMKGNLKKVAKEIKKESLCR